MNIEGIKKNKEMKKSNGFEDKGDSAYGSDLSLPQCHVIDDDRIQRRHGNVLPIGTLGSSHENLSSKCFAKKPTLNREISKSTGILPDGSSEGITDFASNRYFERKKSDTSVLKKANFFFKFLSKSTSDLDKTDATPKKGVDTSK